MIFSIDLYSMKRNTFILKCFIQFTCTNLDGCQKEGCTQKGGFPQKRGVLTLEETIMMMMMMNCFCGMIDRRKAFSLISSWDHSQTSQLQISDTLQAGFEPA